MKKKLLFSILAAAVAATAVFISCKENEEEFGNLTVAVTKVALSRDTAWVTQGSIFTLTATVAPGNATQKTTVWRSSDPSIVSISGDTIAVGIGDSIAITGTSVTAKVNVVGTAIIYATAGNITDSCVVIVPIPIEAFAISNKMAFANLHNGSSQQINVTFTPSNTTERKLNYSVAHEGIVTVSSTGLVTATAVGTVAVTVASAANPQLTDHVNVIVVAPVITSVTLDRTSITFLADDEMDYQQLTATVHPNSTAIDRTVTWESSNTDVVTVSQNGLVTRVGAGTTTVKATSTASPTHFATCAVTVESVTGSAASVNEILGTYKVSEYWYFDEIDTEYNITIASDPADTNPADGQDVLISNLLDVSPSFRVKGTIKQSSGSYSLEIPAQSFPNFFQGGRTGYFVAVTEDDDLTAGFTGQYAIEVNKTSLGRILMYPGGPDEGWSYVIFSVDPATHEIKGAYEYAAGSIWSKGGSGSSGAPQQAPRPRTVKPVKANALVPVKR